MYWWWYTLEDWTEQHKWSPIISMISFLLFIAVFFSDNHFLYYSFLSLLYYIFCFSAIIFVLILTFGRRTRLWLQHNKYKNRHPHRWWSFDLDPSSGNFVTFNNNHIILYSKRKELTRFDLQAGRSYPIILDEFTTSNPLDVCALHNFENGMIIQTIYGESFVFQQNGLYMIYKPLLQHPDHQRFGHYNWLAVEKALIGFYSNNLVILQSDDDYAWQYVEKTTTEEIQRIRLIKNDYEHKIKDEDLMIVILQNGKIQNLFKPLINNPVSDLRIRDVCGTVSLMIFLDFDGNVWIYSDTTKLLHRVSGIPPMTRIAAGSNNIMGVDEQGSLWVCGNNFLGQLGIGGKQRYVNKTSNWLKVESLPFIVEIQCHNHCSFALDDNGSVWVTGNLHIGNHPGPIMTWTRLVELPAVELSPPHPLKTKKAMRSVK